MTGLDLIKLNSELYVVVHEHHQKHNKQKQVGYLKFTTVNLTITLIAVQCLFFQACFDMFGELIVLTSIRWVEIVQNSCNSST